MRWKAPIYKFVKIRIFPDMSGKRCPRDWLKGNGCLDMTEQNREGWSPAENVAVDGYHRVDVLFPVV